MDGQNERIGSLMAFSDIGLILSTYGVLLAFNFIVEPIGINTWIVCTFFLGIKILVVGIADITGIGKSAIISVIFIIIADAIILFVNQLMAFGLSMRMLLAMVLADIVILAAAVLIWKRYADRELPAEENEEWVYSNAPGNAKSGVQLDQQGLDQLFSDQTVEVDKNAPKIDVEEEDLIDESFFTQSSGEEAEEKSYTFNDVSETEPEEAPAEPEFLSFDEITEEIPVEEVIESLEAEEVAKAPEEITEAEVQETPVIIETAPEETAEVTEEAVEEVPEEVVEEVSEEVVPEEAVEEIQEAAETEETESAVFVLPEVESEAVSEETEPQSFSVLDLETYVKVAGREPRMSTTFEPLSTETSQIEIDQYRSEVRHQTMLLDSQLNNLISAFNRAPATDKADRIEIEDRISINHSLKEGDTIIREKLKAMIDREFISEDLLRSLIETTNTINNRVYSLDVAEANLRQRKQREADLRRQKRREEEEKLRAAQEKQRRIREEQRARQQREREKILSQEKQRNEKKTIKTTPVLQNNEVHLQNDDLDIIIDAADLEMLRSFLKEQDEK